jgi:creatinine amidohydrolase
MKGLSRASTLCVAHTCVWLAFGVSAVSLAAQPTSRPIRQSTTAITGGQSNDQRSTGASVRYPTMLDMTFPEFEAAVKKTDIVLLPIGAIEEHSSHLPLGTDAMNATAQMFQVQEYLRKAGFDTILGPPLNIGITNEGGDWTRDGTYAYPGSLTIRKDTFVALYVDVLRSLHDNGLRRAFLYIGHLGTRHVEAVVHVVEEANRTIEGMTVYSAVDSEMLDRIKLAPSTHILSVDKGRNFEMVARLLGRGTELPRTTHADGAETSWTLHFYPEAVRPGYQRFPQSPSSIFLEVLRSGDRSKNPGGSGGFPFDKASAAVGKQIVDYKTARIGDTILQVVKAK